MSTEERASASPSLGQPSQRKRPRLAPTDQELHRSETNLMPRSWLTEEEARTVFREEVERITSHWAKYFQSCMGNALAEIMQQLSSMKNDVQTLREAVELANIHSPHLGRINAKSTVKNDVRNLRLQIQTKLSDPLFTGKKLEGEGGACISVALIDVNTGAVVTSGPESSIKLDVVVLEGDFDKNDEDDWGQEEFENYVVKQREQKGPLLTGDLLVTLKGGVGKLGELIFTDNSSWNRNKRFRIGLKVASSYCGNARIREAKTGAFRVKEHRGEASKKHYPPASNDEVWRLEKIAKDGISHRKLSDAGINKVEDFVLQLFTDSKKLREVLGKSITPKSWESLVDHARTCKTNWKLYLDYTNGMRKHGAVFNTNRQLIGLIKDTVYRATHCFSADEKEYGATIMKKAFDNWNDVGEFNEETFSGSPSQGLQIENLAAVQHYLTPPFGATIGGPEAPPANVGFNAEVLSPGHDSATTLALPGRLQDTHSVDAVKLSVDESVCLAAHQPMFTDPLNVRIPQGYNGITTVEWPIQSPDTNLQYAMCSHMIHSSTQMDHMVNENVSPSEPPSASMSSFQLSRTLPSPEGNRVMDDLLPTVSDDSWDHLLSSFSQSPPHDGMLFQATPCHAGFVRGASRGVNGWLKIKAVLQWGFFIRRRGVRIVQLAEPPVAVQA